VENNLKEKTMKKIIFYWLGIVAFLALPLSGCSSDDDAAVVVNPNAPTAVSVTSSKAVVLADGTDSTVISATVLKSNGTAVADGTTVTFVTTDPDGNLSASSATTTGGVATVSLTHAPILGANNQTTSVTGRAGTASDSIVVKFINQPASVEVLIAFDPAVTNLAALQFVLKNTAGATFNVVAQPISAINAAAGSLVAANFAADSNTIGLTNASGFDTGTTPFIRITYDIVAGAGLPEFSVDAAAEGFIATNPSLGPTTPPVTAANLVVSATFDTDA
jgi:hypothetical protein